jgi:protein MpaA
VLALPALGAAVALASLTAAPAGEGLEAGAQRQVFGHSVRDRPIAARRAGDAGPGFDVLVVGSIHGDERQGHRIIRALRRAHPAGLKDADLWTVMSVNPDGVARRTRKNAQGVDLNRNFSFRFDPDLDGGYESGPRPFSEPESRAVARLSKRVRFDLAIWYHQPWGVTLAPCNRSGRVARAYARLSGLPAERDCDHYTPGSAISWQHHRTGTDAFVVELPDRDLHGREVRRHARAIAALIRKLR